MAQDIAFRPEVIKDDMFKTVRAVRAGDPVVSSVAGPVKRLRAGDFTHHVAAVKARPGARRCQQLVRACAAGRQRGFHRPCITQGARQVACVHAADSRHTMHRQPLRQRRRRAPIGYVRAQRTHHHRRHLRRRRFVVLRVDANVADVRSGEQNRLPAVGRVGQNLLVTGHAGIEHQLENSVSRRAEWLTGQGCPVFQNKRSVLHSSQR